MVYIGLYSKTILRALRTEHPTGTAASAVAGETKCFLFQVCLAYCNGYAVLQYPDGHFFSGLNPQSHKPTGTAVKLVAVHQVLAPLLQSIVCFVACMHCCSASCTCHTVHHTITMASFACAPQRMALQASTSGRQLQPAAVRPSLLRRTVATRAQQLPKGVTAPPRNPTAPESQFGFVRFAEKINGRYATIIKCNAARPCGCMLYN